MTQGLLKKLALAAPLVVCLPFCALGADGPAAERGRFAQDLRRVFVDVGHDRGARPGAVCSGAHTPAPGAPAPWARAGGQLLQR